MQNCDDWGFVRIKGLPPLGLIERQGDEKNNDHAKEFEKTLSGRIAAPLPDNEAQDDRRHDHDGSKDGRYRSPGESQFAVGESHGIVRSKQSSMSQDDWRAGGLRWRGKLSGSGFGGKQRAASTIKASAMARRKARQTSAAREEPLPSSSDIWR